MTNDRPLRLAAYGFVDRDSGSVASASFEILESLLKQGHSVDFYAIKGFVDPRELGQLAGYRYLPVEHPPAERVWRLLDHVPGRARGFLSLVWSQISNALFESSIGRELARAHEDRPYDALLCLGLLSPFSVDGLPAVSWPQGAPNGEWAAIESMRERIIRFNGRRSYLMLKLGYALKTRSARRRLPLSKAVVCGSSWSVGNWKKLAPPGAVVHSVPYPFDLERFQPGPPLAEKRDVFRFLCLGRIVPRKRVDLLLDAFELLRETHPEARLLIIGKFAYANGFESMKSRMTSECGIEYRERIEHSLVPDLLRSVDAVVQPSENEDIGSSVLEGLACGKPAVLGTTNGTADYVGTCSIVFERYEPESLAEAMSRMIELVANDSAGVSRSCREAAERRLSIGSVTDRLLRIIAEARAG